jgi:hypothetical protein
MAVAVGSFLVWMWPGVAMVTQVMAATAPNEASVDGLKKTAAEKPKLIDGGRRSQSANGRGRHSVNRLKEEPSNKHCKDPAESHSEEEDCDIPTIEMRRVSHQDQVKGFLPKQEYTSTHIEAK